MLLQQIFEGGAAARTPASDVSRAEAKLDAAKQELKMIMRNAGSVFQSGIKPEYKSRVDKAKAAVAAAVADLDHAKAIPDIAASLHKGQSEVASNQAAHTPEVKKREFGAAISKGFDDWNLLRKQYGGDRGLNDVIHAAALKQTEDATYPLDVAQLAQSFGVPARSMYKRLEQPELFQTSMLMPKNM